MNPTCIQTECSTSAIVLNFNYMPTNKHKSLLYDFLIEPKFRPGRYLLFILAFTFVAIGQSLFTTFGDHLAVLGSKVYWFLAGNIVVILLVAYINLYAFVPRFLLKNRYMEYIIALFISISIYSVFKGLIEYYILLQIGIVRNINGVTLLDGLSNLTICTISLVSSTISILLKQWITDIREINILKDKQLKSSVEKLKNQINPGSMFDVLDYISEQVKTDSAEASDALFTLSDVLRYELYDCKREKVLLESDIEFIDKLLLLEQLKSNNRFTYTIATKGKPNLFIAPFIFSSVIQQIIGQNLTHMAITFDVNSYAVKFVCKVFDADLTLCDFTKQEQQLSVLYDNDAKIFKHAESIELQLTTK